MEIDQAARLAQLVERRASVAGVVGTNPTLVALFLQELLNRHICIISISLFLVRTFSQSVPIDRMTLSPVD